MGNVRRIYAEKREPFAVEAKSVLNDLNKNLLIADLKNVRILNRYDVEGISEEIFNKAKNIIFAEPQVDDIYFELPVFDDVHRIFAVEYLPGQYDQRADSCAQCIQILTQEEPPTVKTARVYVLIGNISDNDFSRIKDYIINPVESREADLGSFETLKESFDIPTEVETLTGFIKFTRNELAEFIKKYALAMDLDDLLFLQGYFKNDEKRDPTITEIRMIDTYWSDHCRHTTFSTIIDKADIMPSYVKEAYDLYLDSRDFVYNGRKSKPVTLMDIALIAMKRLKKEGKLTSLDESEEINACTVKIKVDIEGKQEDYLLFFKNETHNHPTEIEPFGGAATCLGGAIRDPLSGRAYVYQAMRITGCGDPRTSVKDTISGKLPQKKITQGAAAGYSSYGNQIGLATGLVHEIYHPGYVAKRMEIGAVIGAAPQENVVREVPDPSDVVILLGGRTGRDGCGGATGSSKSHTKESILTCGAEVQKGNPPVERKIQRLFRNPDATKLIKRCNDFGAGGVSVAIGELADGLIIDLNAVPKKYEGLNGTELAISESQERMAVVVSKENADKFIELAKTENLEAVRVAVVTEEPRLKMVWNNKTIVDISRDFLNSNGAEKHTDVMVDSKEIKDIYDGITPSGNSIKDKWLSAVSNLNICSQKGLVERFDSSIGASTVLMPFGGKYQLTETQVMAAKIPVINKKTNTSSVMSYGFNPYVSEKSPFHGAVCAIVESVSKLIASGCSREQCWLTLQEYFERTKNSPERWGKPFSALLGALYAQLKLGIAAIGGKDSMSGSFEDIDVPPTLVSFAVSVNDARSVISPEFKKPGSKIVLFKPIYRDNGLPDFDALKRLYDKVHKMIADGKVLSAWALSNGGICEAISKMSLGNGIGACLNENVKDRLFELCYGAFILEADEDFGGEIIGYTEDAPVIKLGDEKISLSELQKAYEQTLESVFPINVKIENLKAKDFNFTERTYSIAKIKNTKPKVFIPVFPGTNCEYDTAAKFDEAGGESNIFVIRNLTPSMLDDTIKAAAKAISESQIIMIPGGFSGGDEPEGSGKFIATFFRNPLISEEVNNLLSKRDGLMLGICNGFQALIKLGLVPYGEICEMTKECPTLTFNAIGRHQSMMARTKISSVKSPWLMYTNPGEIYTIPVSHGEGRFVGSNELISKLASNGQIATQYVDMDGKPTMDIRFNPNSSIDAIEGILSPDGRVFGKMGHSERIGDNIAKNISGNKDQRIFEAGIHYFK